MSQWLTQRVVFEGGPHDGDVRWLPRQWEPVINMPGVPGVPYIAAADDPPMLPPTPTYRLREAGAVTRWYIYEPLVTPEETP